MTLAMFLITPSIKRWKLAGQPRSPMGEVIQWYCPFPGIVNAVSGWDFSSSCICQNPEVRSRVKKIIEFALPIHSVISLIEYLSMWERLLSSRKSCTTLKPWPCFFGTQKMGELYSEFARFTTPNLSHSSKDCQWTVGVPLGFWIVSCKQVNCL